MDAEKERINPSGAATTAARELPVDRIVFRLDEERWQAFDAALSRESRDVPGLADLMRIPTILDEGDDPRLYASG